MNSVGPPAVTVSPDWLALREPADAAARATDLVAQVRQLLPTSRPVAVHDLGCGTGSMARWLGPQLPGPQHWVMYDRDADLLARAAVEGPPLADDGSQVTIETRQRDITRLDQRDLSGASLITASALLDMLTAAEVERIARSCVEAGCAALLTVSVTGRVALTPSDPLDDAIASAFNAHQRRGEGDGQLLGPDAVGVAADTVRQVGRRGAHRAEPLAARRQRCGTHRQSGSRAGLVPPVSSNPSSAAATRGYVERRLADAGSRAPARDRAPSRPAGCASTATARPLNGSRPCVRMCSQGPLRRRHPAIVARALKEAVGG